MLSLYNIEKPSVNKRNITDRDSALKTLDYLEPKIRDIATFYIRKFCKSRSVKIDSVLRSILRDIVNSIRDNIYFPLAKEYAKFIGVKMDKRKKGEIL